LGTGPLQVVRRPNGGFRVQELFPPQNRPTMPPRQNMSARHKQVILGPSSRFLMARGPRAAVPPSKVSIEGAETMSAPKSELAAFGSNRSTRVLRQIGPLAQMAARTEAHRLELPIVKLAEFRRQCHGVSGNKTSLAAMTSRIETKTTFCANSRPFSYFTLHFPVPRADLPLPKGFGCSG